MKKVVTMGEIMLRLATPNYQKFEQANSFQAEYGGGEANVGLSLAQLGLESSFVTKLPNNPIGKSALQFLHRYGVDTANTILGGDRLGIYFLEKGFSIRSSKVIYDRAHSSFAMSNTTEYDFEAIFADADWFHISGITPALNGELFELTKKALHFAKQKGVRTSCDLNYRSSLWTFEDARVKMAELLKDVDVCIGIEPVSLLDEDGKEIKDALPKNPTVDDYLPIMKEMQKQFGLTHIAMTKREVLSVNRNRLQTLLFDGEEIHQSTKVEVEIVDRVGTGDSFAAGMIYALINDYEPKAAVEFALSTFALKHTVEGDVNLLSFDEVEQYNQNKESLSILR